MDPQEQQEKRQAGLRKAEEMFIQYVQQKKTQLAQLAFETLVELAPDHPKRQEFEIWLRDLDQEVDLQNRLDQVLEAGRQALRQDDLGEARRRLEELRRLDAWAEVGEQFAAEIRDAEQDQAENADIDRLKKSFEELLLARRYGEAEVTLRQLASLDVPKVTLDFLGKHLAESRHRAANEAEESSFEAELQKHLTAKEWQRAREVAHNFGERFPDNRRAAQMFNQVNEMEAAERRQQSLQQGIATFEKFLAEGKRREAELALKLLENLQLSPDRLAALAAKIQSL